MKSKSILNIFLLISLLSGLFVFQPAKVVQALPADQAQGNLTGLIAYIGQDGNVRLMNSDGNNVQQLTSDGGYNSLTWSPNGVYLVLTKGSDKPQSLFIKDLTNKPAQKLSDNVYAFAWDLSGNRIAYSTDQIHIYNVKNNIEEKIIPKDSPGGKYTPSKFGLEFLFWNFWGDNLIYYSEGIQGIHQVNISTLEDTLLFSPSASDHLGELIIQLQYDPFSGYFFGWDYSSQNYQGNPLLISPSGELKILDKFGFNMIWGSPTTANWFPDGKRLVYGSAEDYLFIVDVDINPITASPLLNEDGKSPRWSPDGKTISFTTRKGGLKLFNVDEQKITSLLDDVPASDEDKYLTQGCAIDSCDYTATEENGSGWSPDGNNIILPFKIGFFIYNLKTDEHPWVNGGISPEWQPVKRITLPTVKDLTVQPEIYKSSDEKEKEGIPVTLKWNDPKELVYRTVDAYEIRFAEFPLTDDTWQKGDLLPAPNVKTNLSKGWRIHINPKTKIRKDLYFGIKFHTADGWSPVSNIVKYIDLGFRLNLDGYVFSNSDKYKFLDSGKTNEELGLGFWGEYPSFPSNQDFTSEDMYKMFGSSVCQGNKQNDPNCPLTAKATEWLTNVNNETKEGHCVGMAATSLLIYKEPLKISNLGKNSDQVYDDEFNLKNLITRKYITFYHVEQFSSPYVEYRIDRQIPLVIRPSYTLDQIHDGLINGNYHLLNINLIAGWHSVVPLAISGNDTGSSTVYVYDNNRPDDIKPLTIDRDAEQWNYMGQKNSFGLTFNNMFSVPLSIFTDHQKISWLSSVVATISSGSVGSSFVTNDLGQRLGVIDGNLETEIPDGNMLPILNGSNSAYGFMYVLPVGEQYKMHLKGVGDGQTSSATFFSTHSGLVIDNIKFPDKEDDILAYSGKTAEFSYKSSEGQSLSIDFAVDNDDLGYLFTFSKMGINPGQELTVKYSANEKQLILLPASNDAFDLNINRMTLSGDNKFSHRGIQFLNAKTIAFDIGAWDGRGALTAQIDYDGDGKYDEVVKISNQESFIGRAISYKYSSFLFCGTGFALFLIGALGLIFVRRKAR